MNKLFVLSALAVFAYVSAAPSADKDAEWKNIFDKYIQECKTQENANDEDVKIFASHRQMPANEVQSCLLQCLDTKTGMIKDGKLNHDTYMNAAKYIHGDSKEKMEEAENFFKKCQPEVEKKSVDKCGSGAAMRACIIELSNHH